MQLCFLISFFEKSRIFQAKIQRTGQFMLFSAKTKRRNIHAKRGKKLPYFNLVGFFRRNFLPTAQKNKLYFFKINDFQLSKQLRGSENKPCHLTLKLKGPVGNDQLRN